MSAARTHLRWLFSCCVALLLCALPSISEAQSITLQLWHSYRGAEQDALNSVLQRFMQEHPELRVETLAVPFDAYASKLEAAIPHGHGPDVFIDAHERLASYHDRNLLLNLTDAVGDPAVFEPGTVQAFTLQSATTPNQVFGLPLSTKCLALFVNDTLYATLDGAPLETLEQLEQLRARLPSNTYPLVYYSQNAYFHQPLLAAYGGSLFNTQTLQYGFVGTAAEQSLQRVQRLIATRVIPDEADGAQVSQSFRSGRAVTAISGPWFVGELQNASPPVPFHILPLPRVQSTGRAMAPFVTVEGAFVSAQTTHRPQAIVLLQALVSAQAALVRARVGRQVVATSSAWTDPALRDDSVLAVFRQAALHGTVMPTHPSMRLAFEPANQAIRRALRDPAATQAALSSGVRRFAIATRTPPARQSPTLFLIVMGSVALALAFRAVQRSSNPDFRKNVRASLPAYRYVTHAVLVLLLLVVAPLVIGAFTSLCAGRNGELYYVGLSNYWQILSASGESLFASGSFYFVLLVNVLWTVANLFLHMAIGVALALVLARPWVKMRALYRVLLIVPWAVPSYVTALAWKGMFQRQSGAINALLRVFGVDPISWFAQFSTAFTANLLTNTWLGFPFMMVVTLGALTSIPKDLYEAASVDGATAWQQFKLITLPMLKPTLLPAASMGAVWTFNQFNVIFLVSGGEPDGATEILVTEAYRWAFTRQAQYGYAAAYSVLIFAVLVLLTRGLERLTGAKK